MTTVIRELTPKEMRSIKGLVKGLCANYDAEYGCLPLSGSPQNQRFCGERRIGGMNEFSPTVETNDMELVTSSDCPMFGICYTNSAMCRYFREAVLPNDPELLASLEGQAVRSCQFCGKKFPTDGKRAYCSDQCAAAARRQQTAARVRKFRNKTK